MHRTANENIPFPPYCQHTLSTTANKNLETDVSSMLWIPRIPVPLWIIMRKRIWQNKGGWGSGGSGWYSGKMLSIFSFYIRNHDCSQATVTASHTHFRDKRTTHRSTTSSITLHYISPVTDRHRNFKYNSTNIRSAICLSSHEVPYITPIHTKLSRHAYVHTDTHTDNRHLTQWLRTTIFTPWFQPWTNTSNS